MSDTKQNQPTATELAGTVEVDNLDQFVQILCRWHAEKCAQVRHLTQVPEGSSFSIGDGADAKEIVLTGDAHAAFKLGVEMALMQLGTLPFAAEFEDEPGPADAAG